MSILDYFRSSKKNSADTAKERLQIIVAHQRSNREGHNNAHDVNLQVLKQRLIDVISDFLHIDENEFRVELERDQGRSVLELNVTLPDDVPEEVQ